MDYTVGSIADLISGKQTPNKPKVIAKIVTATPKSPNQSQSSPNLKKKRKAENDDNAFSNKSSPRKKIKVRQRLSSPSLKKKRKAENNDNASSDKSSSRKKIKTSHDQFPLTVIDYKVADKLDDIKKEGVEVLNEDIEEFTTGTIIDPLVKEEIDSRTVFVGNVDISVTKKELTKLFKKYGKIESIRLRNVTPAKPGVSRRLAAIKRIYHDKRTTLHSYIKFAKREDAVKATALNTLEHKGHHLRVELCGGSDKPDETRAIFVGNLPFDVEDDDLWSAFEVCGEIKSVRIVRNNVTGMGIGIGYVNFESSDSVELALEMDDMTIKKRVIRVQRCGEKNKKKKLKNMRHNQQSYQPGSKDTRASNEYNKNKIVKNKKEQTKPNLQKMEKKQTPAVAIDKSAFQGSKSLKKKKKPKQNKGLLKKIKLSQKIAPRLTK